MSFTNINDPAGVKALLDNLRNSQEWRQNSNPSSATAATPVSASSESTHEGPSSSRPTSADGSNSASPVVTSPTMPTVASLLSQLKTAPAKTDSWRTPPAQHAAQVAPISEPPLPRTSRSKNLRTSTFQQALPYIAQRSDDSKFVAAIAGLKAEQDALEQHLWTERGVIRRKHQEKVKAAQAKAKLIGSGISKHEADMMTRAFRADIERFDRERVLKACDALVGKQQSKLESLGVPTMFFTDVRSDRERQQRVVQVLEGLLGSPQDEQDAGE